MSYGHLSRDHAPYQGLDQQQAEMIKAKQERRDYLRAEEEALQKQAYMREMHANQIRGAGAIAGAGAIGRNEALVSRSAGLEHQMERLARTVASTEELFNQLGIRMTPFVKPLPIQEQAKEPRQERDSQSPLADQVARITDQLDRINRGMTYLIDGVDL